MMLVSVRPPPAENNNQDEVRQLWVSKNEIIEHILDSSSTKNQLRDLWAQVLQLDPSEFTDQDAFFDLGGNSISAQDLATEAEKEGIFLTIEQIFMYATLEEMAQEATRVRKVDNTVVSKQLRPFGLLRPDISVPDVIKTIAKSCGVVPEQVQNAYPCTPMQESLVTISDGNENFSVRQLVYKLADDVSLTQFQQAWSAVASEHPVLRTRIGRLEGELRYLQAVIDEDVVWTTTSAELARHLELDESVPMKLWDRLFRYTIVVNNDDNGQAQRYFVWTAHHALSDAATVLGVLDDVAKQFKNKSTLQRPPFERFVEYTLGIDSNQEQEFWKRSLSGIDATSYPPLPQDLDFYANPSSTQEHTIKLAQRPSTFGLTKALLLRAAWGILLSHHTGTENVVFGVIGNGRNSSAVPGISQMIGPTINLLPITLQINPKQSVVSFLEQVRVQAAELMAFEHSGVSKIRHYLDGGGSTAADFQTLFVVHPSEFSEEGAAALQALGLEYIDHMGKTEQHPYPLVVSLTLSADTAATIKMQYDDRVISNEQVSNLINQFQTVLLQLSNATADTLLESISSLSDQDLAQIYEWNQTSTVARETCIHQLFQQQVHKNPNAEAVCSLERSLTYAEVDNMSSELALRLIGLGIGLETFVAVSFEKSIWTVVAILAVFKAGGIYVPIDPAHPRGRIVEVIETVQIKVAIASKVGFEALDGLVGTILTVDNLASSYATSSLEQLPTSVQPSNTAYLLFTSGSTGRPKGVLISHSAMSTSIVHHGPAFGASPNWRTLQFSAHTFDISMTEFFTTLAFGGCICVPSEHDRLNNLAGTITALKVNVALIVPTVANLISPAEVPTLKTIVLGGEPVTKEIIVRWADHVRLIAGYGPSETAVYCSGNLNVSTDTHPADIGRSIGATMWITNAENHNKLSAIGCVGEIVISGPLLGKGYFGDQATTALSFVPAPKWLESYNPKNPHKLLYKTGDLARYNSDGTFRIIGRRDTQVKLRGFRIELGEIENRIMEQDSITAALAVLPKQGPCARQLVAVVSFTRSTLGSYGSSGITLLSKSRHPETDGLLDEVKSRLSLHLPDYMIPSIWVSLEKMPLLISGKLDRRAIKLWVDQMSPETYKELVRDEDDERVVKVMPGTIAATIQKIWSDVLKVPFEQIGMTTSFFSLGGDSIAAIQIVSKAKEIGLPLTVRGILSQKILGNLANFVEQSNTNTSQTLITTTQSTDVTPAYTQIVQSRIADKPGVTIEDTYPLTPLQREIMKQREINPAVFVLGWKMEFISTKSQPISLDRLLQSWKIVVQRHHVLHSIFVKDPDKNLPPCQAVLVNAEPDVVISSTAPGDVEPTLDDLLPPLDDCFLPHRAHFSQYGDKIFGHIELDHLVIDGWSFRLLKEDLLSTYNAPNTSFSVAASSFRSVVDTHQPGRIDADRKHWASVLGTQRPSILSCPPAVQRSEFEPKTVIYLPTLEVEVLSAFSAQHSITTASIFDAAWAQTLSIYTDSPDVSFEYVVSGRDREIPGIFEIVGPVMNLSAYHLRGVTSEHGSQALANLAYQMQEQRLQDAPHISCNIREVFKEDLNADIPFNTALNFQRRPLGVTVDDLEVHDILEQSSDPWHFDILVRVMHLMDGNIIRPTIEFDARDFDLNEMERVADIFWKKVQIAIS
ncbi:non-ribosomal peptide synthetase module [Xylogone sp. PMI_703]|nr:non-ribosomal peptide synthetase module [Xylogone sp. PMI_703]